MELKKEKNKYLFLLCLLCCFCNTKQDNSINKKKIDVTIDVSYMLSSIRIFVFEIKNKKLIWGFSGKSDLKEIYKENDLECCFTKDSISFFTNYYEKELTNKEIELLNDTLSHYIATYKKKLPVTDNCYSRLIVHKNNIIISQEDEDGYKTYQFMVNFVKKDNNSRLINKLYKFEAYFQTKILSKSLPHAPLIPD